MSFITDLLTGNINVTGSVIPSNNAAALGSSTNGWSNVFLNNGNVVSIAASTINLPDLYFDQVLAYSTNATDHLEPGDYGLVFGVSAPYTVIQLTSANYTVDIGDNVSGINIPPFSSVIFVGSDPYYNVIIIDQTVQGILPPYGTPLSFARPSQRASLAVLANAQTDLYLKAGDQGQITSDGNFLSANDGLHDIGARLSRFSNLWLAGNIYLTDQTLGYIGTLGVDQGNLNIVGPGLSVGQAGAGVPVSIKLFGMVDVGTTGGTFYPEIGWSGTPGTVTVYALSRMSITPISTNSGNTSVGTWA